MYCFTLFFRALDAILPCLIFLLTKGTLEEMQTTGDSDAS